MRQYRAVIGHRISPPKVTASLLALVLLASPAALRAQTHPAPTLPEGAPPPMELLPETPAPPPEMPAVPEPPVAPAPAAVPADKPSAVAPAVSPAERLFAQAGTRVDVRVQNPVHPGRLDDVGSSGQAMVELGGQLHAFLKWQVGFLGYYGPTASPVGATAATSPTRLDGSATVYDLVAKLEFADAAKVWLGRMPMPSNRTSLSSAWAVAAWTLPGRYGFYPAARLAGPRLGAIDRGDGVAFWGQIRGGRCKYYLGAFGLEQPKGTSPLVTGRLSLSLLDPEPGFGTYSFYGGEKRVLSVAAFAQHQRGGSLASAAPAAGSDDFSVLGGDLLLEAGNDSAGTLDIEGEFSKTWGQNELQSYQLFASLGYLIPLEIGFGRIQPLVRLQRAGKGPAAGADELIQVDAQLGYVVDGTFVRLAAVYQYAHLSGLSENAVIFGVQLLSRGR